MADLNALNYLNLVGYIINVLVTFASSSVFGFPNNAELSEKYQTIVTPAGGTFAIWAVIFLSQGVFAVLQMFADYRSHPLVQEGISYNYMIACVFQSLWTFAFGYEFITLSLFMMGGILASLLLTVVNQSKLESEPSVFWFLKFPFSIHCGWIIAAFGVNFNVFILNTGAQAGTQEAWAFVTLAYATLFACFALFGLSPPDFTIPWVLVWATAGIASELRDPKDSIMVTFSDNAITRVRSSVFFISVALAIVTVFYVVKKRVKKKSMDTVENESFRNGDSFVN